VHGRETRLIREHTVFVSEWFGAILFWKQRHRRGGRSRNRQVRDRRTGIRLTEKLFQRIERNDQLYVKPCLHDTTGGLTTGCIV